VSELKKIASSNKDGDESEEDPQELSHLCEEASMPIEQVLTKIVSGEEGEGGGGEEVKVEVSPPDEEKAGGSSTKKPLNPQVESLQRTSTGLVDPIKKSSGLGAPPPCNLSPFLRAKPNAPAEKDRSADGEDAKQTLEFKEESSNGDKEEGSSEKDEKDVKKEHEVKKEDVKTAENGDVKDGAPPLVNGTNGHHDADKPVEEETKETNGGAAAPMKLQQTPTLSRAKARERAKAKERAATSLAASHLR